MCVVWCGVVCRVDWDQGGRRVDRKRIALKIFVATADVLWQGCAVEGRRARMRRYPGNFALDGCGDAMKETGSRPKKSRWTKVMNTFSSAHPIPFRLGNAPVNKFHQASGLVYVLDKG